MKLESRIKKTKHEQLEKILVITMMLCLVSISIPVNGNAQNGKTTPCDFPSYNGKLNLTPLNEKQLENVNALKLQEENSGLEAYIAENATPLNAESATPNTSKDIRVSDSIQVTEDASNLYIVQGSRPDNSYQNSTNVNNGFYMNYTNPDGSSMSFGSYFNSNNTNSGARKRSSSQIIIDKVE